MFFKEQIKRRIKNEKGLTLVELLAVIVILAIIAAIAIPSIGNIIANSRAKAVIADAQNAMSAANIYFTDVSNDTNFVLSNPKVTTDDEIENYLEKGSLQSFAVTKATTPGEANKISFTAVNGGKTYTVATDKAVTLDQLNNAEYNKGVIKIPTGTDENNKTTYLEIGN